MFIPRIKHTTKKRLKQLERDIGSKKYKEWREAVLARDGFCCQWAGCSNENNLQVHHIKTYAGYLHLRYNVYNGITLCKECHEKTFGKEDLYAVILTKKAIANADRIEKNKNIDGHAGKEPPQV